MLSSDPDHAAASPRERAPYDLGEVFRAFERATGCSLTFRAFSEEWRSPPFKEIPKRFLQHANPFCFNIKQKEYESCYQDCVARRATRCKAGTSHGDDPAMPDTLSSGAVHERVCHAGASELTVRLVLDHEIVGLLHLGPYRTDPAQPRELRLIPPQQVRWLRTLAEALSDHLIRIFQECRRHRQTQENELLRQIERFFDERLELDPSRDELAAWLGKSPHWVSHYIRQNTGKTFREIKTARRLARAGHLLKATDLKIEAVAGELGMELTHFYRFFREQTGSTPAAYRREFQLPRGLV